MNWKTIDKLKADVPGVRNSYHGETVEFDVRLGRHVTPLYLGEKYEERFRIESKEFDIMVEAPTLHEAKELLRAKLAASEDYSGEWKLWMKVDVSGGYDHSWHSEQATCTINVAYVLELTTKKGGKTRKRHADLRTPLPSPFVGEFPKLTTHKELSNLRDGPAKPKPASYVDPDDVWIEATPEIVETVRDLQRRLGESGDKVKAALSKKRFLETLEAVRLRSGARLLGTSLVDSLENPNS